MALDRHGALIRTVAAFLVAPSIATPALSQSQVWIVDDSGGAGVSHTIIQGAINAAADGDFILVRRGAYSGFTINGKSLTIEFEEGGAGTLSFLGSLPIVTIQNTTADQAVVLRGLQPTAGTIRIVAQDALGPIWLEECILEPNLPPTLGIGVFVPTPILQPALRATDCALLVLVRCVVRGNVYSYSPAPVYADYSVPGSQGLETTQSHVVAYDSSFTGGLGKSHYPCGFGCGGSPGGDGASLDGGSLFASDCTFQGGNGGNGSSPGHGGDGLVAGPSTIVKTYNALAVAGFAGGVPYHVEGPWLERSGPRRASWLSSPAQVGESVTLTIELGVASDVYLFAATSSGAKLDLGGVAGPFLIGLPDLDVVPLGTLPAGVQSIQILVPSIPSATPGAEVWVQALFTDSSFSFMHLGSPSHVSAVANGL